MRSKEGTVKEGAVNVTISVDGTKWASWCDECERLGFTGTEFAMLLFAYFSKAGLSLQMFEEFDEPPAWARGRLLAGLLKEYGGEGKKHSPLRDVLIDRFGPVEGRMEAA